MSVAAVAPRAGFWVKPRRRTAVLIVLALLAVAALGFLSARSRRDVTENVACSSGEETIMCRLSNGATISVPTDVAWTDKVGTWHMSGRPACLPPGGTQEVGPVGITWTKVSVNGMEWRQVLSVAC